MKAGYFLATAIQAAGSFVIVALLTRVLGPQEFGRWALLEPLLLLGAQAVGWGVTWGIVKLIAHDELPATTALRLLGRRLPLFAVPTALVIGGAVAIWQEAGVWVVALIAFLLAESALGLVLSASRGANQASAYLAGVATKALLAIGLLLICWQWKPNFIAHALELVGWWACWSALAALFAYGLLSGRCSGKSDAPAPARTSAEAFRGAVSYGGPILAAAGLAAVVSNADRYVLGAHFSHETVGQYVVIAKAAAAMNLLVTPLNLWWPTARFRHLKDRDAGAQFFRCSALVLGSLLALCAAGIYLAVPTLVHWFSPGLMVDAWTAAALCASALLISMTAIMNVGTLKEGKTHWSIVTVGLAAAVQLLVAVAVVPRFGMQGAAISTVASSALSLVFQNAVSQRIHPVPYAYGRMALLVVLVIGWTAGATMLTPIITLRLLLLAVCAGVVLLVIRHDLKSFVSHSS